MAERPIKKSELEKRAQTEGQTGDDKKQIQKGRKDGRGKGRNNKDREKRKPAVPLALMRGPRPSAKVEEPEPVETPEEAIAETTTEEEGAVAEATETVAEATETVAEAETDSPNADASEASEAEPAPDN